MILHLNNIDVDCIIGERADERLRTQHLRIDATLKLRDETAAHSDRLVDTVDYATLTEKIRNALTAAKCQMIERAAYLVCQTCLTEEKVGTVRATVTKYGAIAHLESAAATFEIKRSE